MNGETRTILLVEDDPDDVMLLREGLKSGKGLVDMQVAEDGVEAMAYLRGAPPFSGAPRPALILLDLKLPRMSGLEVLAEIKKDPSLRLIPVLVLTTSSAGSDVQEAYALGANCFLPKPTGLAEIRALAVLIEDFWFVHAHLPDQPIKI